ncbi:Helix-turn-helix [Pedococcus dokdonensis]|uniref:Helix-turn-helix n=2 Tax=Pedococcus dokdonensis TaxID=443156 RepID=A0A1H0U3P9_9MICO|nr:Helix-turn-helix [Pedococcus dokdonensis]
MHSVGREYHRIMDSAGIPDLANKLQRLFRTIPQPDGRGWYTNEVVVRELAAGGVPVTVQHLSNLRNGRRDNPSARLLAGIAKVFGVPVGYFFDSAEEKRVNEDLETLSQLRRMGGLRLRGDLDAEGLVQLLGALKEIQRMEGKGNGED